jgi:ATP-dependent Lon protease
MTKPRSIKPKELKSSELRWNCDPKIFDFESTKDLLPLEGILGQERALKAIKLGVEIKSPGYNIYIAGLSGSGKASSVKEILERVSSECLPLKDYAYVNNFKDSDRPILLTFDSGKAKEFKNDLYSSIDILKNRIPQSLDNEMFTTRKKKIVEHYNQKEHELFGNFEDKLSKENFSLGQIKVGEVVRPDLLPVIDNNPIPIYQLDDKIKEGKISKEEAQEVIKKYKSHQQELQAIFKKGLKLSQEFQTKLLRIERETVEIVVKSVVENLKDEYKNEKINDYLSQVEEDILDNIQIFKGLKPEQATTDEGLVIDYFKVYEVNVILDNTESKQCPVIIETSPSFTNIFGTIEKLSDGRGGWYTDFTKIKAGSLLRANNGFLVINVNHLLEEPGVWRVLKRVLSYRKLEIQEPPGYFQMATTMLKPESIEIDAKIILIGSQHIYSMLANYEYDFKKIFKVKADFDYEIKRNDEVLVKYAQVVKKLIKDEGLLDFDNKAIAALIEISARYAGQKDKLTTRFSQIADLAREASFWAGDDGFQVVSNAHIRKAFAAAKDRHGMLESKITDMLTEETILIDTDGERIGQINGLAVYNADFYSFGRPTRITATVSLGGGSIINVEREAGMSGRHYNKGVLIISGYFRETFGQDQPLSFNANLVFEQSYGTVDGDSASCAEIFALVSTLAGLPIKQSIAVTGSLNQKGDVQPIGGVNEKIEGFYDVCKAKKLTGKQGVIMPIQNIKDLMLREDIIASVEKGEFHIYPIERVEEGIEILTGVKSGKRLPKGGYPEGTVFDLVEKKIKDLYRKSRAGKMSNNTVVTRKKRKK